MTEIATLADVFTEQARWTNALHRAQERERQAKKRQTQCYAHLGIRKAVDQIATLLAPAFPKFLLEVSGPFGLGNECQIWAYRRAPVHVDNRAAGVLNFRAGTGDTLLELVDRSRTTDEYPPGSLGAVNGLNHQSVAMPDDIEGLAAILRDSISNRARA